MLTRQVLVLGLASALFASVAEAAPIIAPLESGRIVGSIIVDVSGTPFAYDISVLPDGSGGTTTGLGMVENSTLVDVSAALDVSTGFTNFLVATPDFQQFVVLTFDFANGIFDDPVPGAWLLPGLGFKADGSNPITSPLLLALMGEFTARLMFLDTFILNDQTRAHVFEMESITPVPEPASLILLGVGAAAAFTRRRRVRLNAVR